MSNKQQIYWFYKADKLNKIKIEDRFSSFFFTPTIFHLKQHKGSVLLYLFWYIFSFGRYKIFYIMENETNKMAHFSNIIPKIFKYSFMGRKHIQIVNCYTLPLFRGCRLFSLALSVIGEEFKNTVVWVGSREDNVGSIKSIKRAGYKMVARVYKTKFLGIYKLIEDE